jgi:hypothetical protein
VNCPFQPEIHFFVRAKAFVRRTNAGFHKHGPQQYKNILIYCGNHPDPRAMQGPGLYLRASAPDSQSVVGLPMAYAVRHNRSFPPQWAKISVFSSRNQRHGNT